MATRAVYTFKDSTNTFHVYKHHDGYPAGAAQWIQKALPYAWELPRFEASEFATAFIAGNKPMGGGGVYLTETHRSHGDLDYRYEITFNGSHLIVHAYSLCEREHIIFEGTLGDFLLLHSRR